MKKIMLSSIVLLPLVVLLILTLGGMVVSKTNYIYVERVEFTQTDTLVLIKDGEERPTAKLSVNVLPLRASNAAVRFASDDESIVTVDEKGVVTGVDYGETFVRVYSQENGALSAARRVRVTDDAVHRIEIENAPSVLYTGQSAALSAKVYPQDAPDTSVVWSSSDESVLYVSADGALTPRKKGEATVFVRSVSDPSVTASAEIEVKVPVSGIWLDPAEQGETVVAGSSAQFPAVHFEPADAEETVVYSSSDDSVASVDQTGAVTFKKAGTVEITATVTDGAGNTRTVKKTFTSTQGAYTSIGFDKTRLEVDYDELGEDKALDISVVGAPEGANADFEISFDQEGVVAYDEETGKFTAVGTSKTPVKITVTSKTADGKEISGTMTVVITRKASEVKFTQDALEANQNPVDLSAYVEATEMHTDTLVYSVSDPSIAEVDGSQILFKREGTVVVTVRSEEGGAEDGMALSYFMNVTPEDKRITVDEDFTGEETVVLNYYDADRYDKAVLTILPPEGYTLESVTSGDEKIAAVSEDGTRVIPVSGGYTDVTVRAQSDARAVWEKTFRIFVHKQAVSVSFSPEDALDKEGSGFVTAKTEISFTDPVITPADAAHEKTFVWSVNDAQTAQIEGGVLTFKKAGTAQVTVAVMYEGERETFRIVTVRSTFGAAESFDLMQDGKKAEAGAKFTFADVGASFAFTAENPFPSDAPLQPEFSFSGSSFSVSSEGSGFSVTSMPVAAAEVPFTVSVGNADVTITLVWRALAQGISVSAGGTALKGGTDYKTLESGIQFTVSLPNRGDGLAPSDRGIEWSAGGGVWNEVQDNAFTFTLAGGANTVEIRSKDGSASAQESITIEKLAALSDFGVRAEYPQSSGGNALAGELASAKDGGTLSLTLPKTAAKLFLYIVPAEENLLGGVPEECISFEGYGGWTVSYDEEGNFYDISFTGETGAFARTPVLKHGGFEVQLNVSRSGLDSIVFTGFDMQNRGDVYAGYQQVRVFGKSSYYGGQKVNYFKMPLALTGSAPESGSLADLVTWKLTPYKGDGPDESAPSTVQQGKTVLYGGKTYLVQADGTLKDESGAAAPSDVMWVDAWSEEGYARIYFGGFNGLSEEDIRSDNFGDFDGTLDEKGAVGDGTFLRVEASDGSVNGAGDDYNFNVVNDGVNVFDAAGYTANSTVVLQENLYSTDDSASATTSAQVLATTTAGDLTKTLIYGNGYQVDMGDFNKANADPSNANAHTQIAINRVYNTVLKGAPAKTDEGIDGDTRNAYCIEVKGTHYYYCDLQALHRIYVDDGVTTYIQNCVFRYMADCSVSLVYSSGSNSKGGGTAYIKNVVGIDSGDSTFEWTYGTYHFSGFVDVFNYKNANEIADILNLGILSFLVTGTIRNMFKTGGDFEDYGSFAGFDSKKSEPYANIAGFSTTAPSEANGVWLGSGNNGQGTWSDPTRGIVSDGETTLHVLYKNILAYPVSFLTTRAAENDYNTFKCHYAEEGESLVFNALHLAWHAARVYRNTELVGWHMEDHVAGENTL